MLICAARMRKFTGIFLFMAVTLIANSTIASTNKSEENPNHFIGIEKFSKFKKETANNENILTSPEIKSPAKWNELVVSWNADAPAQTYLKIEARGIYSDHATKFYTMGLWAVDATKFPRESIKGQKDSDGRVNTDTLILSNLCEKSQVRITLGSADKNVAAKLNFLGLSFLDSKTEIIPRPPNKKAWGKIIETPERSQNSYPEEQGWCSATSLAMVMMRWSDVLHRPDLHQDVRDCAAGILDQNFGTGNWPFNTAFAGKFPGMRAYVSRFNDISELEDWVVAGIPVVISAPFHLLERGRKNTGSGHVVTVIGFTDNGDVVINDPATNLEKGQKVRHTYKRENVEKAWKTSHNTVYLIYPESAKIPKNRLGHWD